MARKTRKRYLWSRGASKKLTPYAILECSRDIAQEIDYLLKNIARVGYEGFWKFIADKLHKLYPHKFPSWWDEYGRRDLFWYNNVLEDFDKGYERLVEEYMKKLSRWIAYDDEESLRADAEWEVEKVIEKLPVYVLK
jgi:hypothetical protein